LSLTGKEFLRDAYFGLLLAGEPIYLPDGTANYVFGLSIWRSIIGIGQAVSSLAASILATRIASRTSSKRYPQFFSNQDGSSCKSKKYGKC
jgi:hypothetical protein